MLDTNRKRGFVSSRIFQSNDDDYQYGRELEVEAYFDRKDAAEKAAKLAGVAK